MHTKITGGKEKGREGDGTLEIEVGSRSISMTADRLYLEK
jgi:hypothetical protein